MSSLQVKRLQPAFLVNSTRSGERSLARRRLR